MCGFTPTKPSQLWKASEPFFFFFFLFQSMRTFLAFHVGCCVGKPDPDLPYSLISRSAFSVESSVCINLLGPTQKEQSSLDNFDGAFSVARPKNSSCLQAWNWLTLSWRFRAGKNRLRSDEKLKLREVRDLPQITQLSMGEAMTRTQVS